MADDNFGALESMIQEADALNPAAVAAQAKESEQQAQQATDAKAWAFVPKSIGRLLAVLVPELGGVYTDDACTEWGESMAPVAAKHGWSGPDALPELQLAIVTAGLAVPSVLLVRAKLQMMREAAKAAKPQQPQQVAGPPAEVLAPAGVSDGSQ